MGSRKEATSSRTLCPLEATPNSKLQSLEALIEDRMERITRRRKMNIYVHYQFLLRGEEKVHGLPLTLRVTSQKKMAM